MTSTICVRCGDESGTEIQIFQVPYGQPLTLFFGLLAYRMTRKVHEVDACFCEPCWRRYRVSRLIWPNVLVIITLLIAIGLYCSAVYKTDEPIGYLMIAAVSLPVVGFLVQRYLRPRVIVATEELVKIRVPRHGVLTINQSNASGLLSLGLGDKSKDR